MRSASVTPPPNAAFPTIAHATPATTLPTIHCCAAPFIAPPSPRQSDWRRVALIARSKLVPDAMMRSTKLSRQGIGNQNSHRPTTLVDARTSPQVGLAGAFHEPAGIALRLGAGVPPQHPGQLPQTLLGIQAPGAGRGAALGDTLLDGEMVIRQGGDLRQMRDTQHLPSLTKGVQAFSDGFGHGATD